MLTRGRVSWINLAPKPIVRYFGWITTRLIMLSCLFISRIVMRGRHKSHSISSLAEDKCTLSRRRASSFHINRNLPKERQRCALDNEKFTKLTPTINASLFKPAFLNSNFEHQRRRRDFNGNSNCFPFSRNSEFPAPILGIMLVVSLSS